MAIISDTYSDVKAALSVSEDKYLVADHFGQLWADVKEKFNCNENDRICSKIVVVIVLAKLSLRTILMFSIRKSHKI